MAMNKHLKFDNLHQFWGYAFRESNAYNRSSRDVASSWNGGISWEESKKLALTGWKDGLDRINKIQAEISPRITNQVIKQQPVYSVVGHNVDVGRFLSNDPECFNLKEIDVSSGVGKVITLVVSVGCSCEISSETIIQKGAMVCALIDAFEYAGNRVEVICNSASSSCLYNSNRKGYNKEEGWIEVDVVLKEPDQALNMVELAFCLAHPAMFRRMVFSVRELVGWSDLVSNYGYSSKATNKGDIYIEEIFSGEVSNDKAVDWVMSNLKNLGVKLQVND